MSNIFDPTFKLENSRPSWTYRDIGLNRLKEVKLLELDGTYVLSHGDTIYNLKNLRRVCFGSLNDYRNIMRPNLGWGRLDRCYFSVAPKSYKLGIPTRTYKSNDTLTYNNLSGPIPSQKYGHPWLIVNENEEGKVYLFIEPVDKRWSEWEFYSLDGLKRLESLEDGSNSDEITCDIIEINGVNQLVVDISSDDYIKGEVYDLDLYNKTEECELLGNYNLETGVFTPLVSEIIDIKNVEIIEDPPVEAKSPIKQFSVGDIVEIAEKGEIGLVVWSDTPVLCKVLRQCDEIKCGLPTFDIKITVSHLSNVMVDNVIKNVASWHLRYANEYPKEMDVQFPSLNSDTEPFVGDNVDDGPPLVSIRSGVEKIREALGIEDVLCIPKILRHAAEKMGCELSAIVPTNVEILTQCLDNTKSKILDIRKSLEIEESLNIEHILRQANDKMGVSSTGSIPNQIDKLNSWLF